MNSHSAIFDLTDIKLKKIPNYFEVTRNISTAGQPSADEIGLIADSSFKVVINLGLDNESYSLKNEAELVQILGMKYIHIPVDFDKPKFEDYEKFEFEMDLLESDKVLVHCAANKRVSVFLALYLMREYEWKKSEAIALILNIWTPNECWKIFFSSVSKFQLSTLNF